MHAHANAHRRIFWPGRVGEGARGLRCGGDGLGGDTERDAESVALGVYLAAVRSGKGGAEQLLVQTKRLGIADAKLLLQPRAALDISEEEGDSAGGQIRRHA